VVRVTRPEFDPTAGRLSADPYRVLAYVLLAYVLTTSAVFGLDMILT